MATLTAFAIHSSPRSAPVRFALQMASLISLMAAGAAHAQDAKTILNNMVGAYRMLPGYQGRATVTDRHSVNGGGVLAESSFTYALLYQKPNMLKIEFTMPSGGRQVYYDGTTLTLYQSQLQTYSSASIPAADLRQLAPALLKFQVSSKLDVLYFLSGYDMPPTLSGFERRPDQTRNGRPVYVVTAKERTVNPKVAYGWTWFIDKQSNLLARIEARLSKIPQAVRVRQGKKSVVKQITIDRLLYHNILEPQTNTKIDNRLFRFTPPAGSTKVEPPAANPAGKVR